MSGNFAIKGGGGGGGRLMANAILNFHFDFLKPSLNIFVRLGQEKKIFMRFEILPPILSRSDSAQAVLKLLTPVIIFHALEPHPSPPNCIR